VKKQVISRSKDAEHDRPTNRRHIKDYDPERLKAFNVSRLWRYLLLNVHYDRCWLNGLYCHRLWHWTLLTSAVYAVVVCIAPKQLNTRSHKQRHTMNGVRYP